MANKTMGKKTTSSASSWWAERSKILASITKPARVKPKKAKAKVAAKAKKVAKAKKTAKAKKVIKAKKGKKTKKARR